MEPSRQSGPSALPVPGDGLAQPRWYDDRLYQAVTVVSILLVLLTAWVF